MSELKIAEKLGYGPLAVDPRVDLNADSSTFSRLRK